MRFLAGVILGATIGAILRRLVGLVVGAAVLALMTGQVDRVGPVTVTGSGVLDRVQNVRFDSSRWSVGSIADHVSGALPGGADQAHVVRAIDGDTLVVKVDGKTERVRVLGIDTPETVKPGAAVGCFGPQASQSAKAWVKTHRTVRLRSDRAAPSADRYGRLLRYVDPTGDGRDLSVVQVSGGYARVASYGQKLSRLGDLERAERRARRAGRGLWGAC